MLKTQNIHKLYLYDVYLTGIQKHCCLIWDIFNVQARSQVSSVAFNAVSDRKQSSIILFWNSEN